MSFEVLSPSEQVASYLYSLIMEGQWEKHLPGTPAISQETGIDRKTITAAIHLLEEQGIIRSQGIGKPRNIVIPERHRKKGLKVTVLVYEELDRTKPLIEALCRRLYNAGHIVSLSKRTLTSMKMDLARVSRYMRENPSDVWIPMAASKEILEWMSQQTFATMALFGRRQHIDIASVGPDKTAATKELTEKLVSLGHRRIVLFSREERRHPNPGMVERVFLETLEEHRILSNKAYHLPEWTSNAAGFKKCLDELFQHTRPTALIVEESQFFFAALQHMSKRGLAAPEHLSIACTDDDPVFEMSHPRVSCIHWEIGPVIDYILRWTRQVSLRRVSRKQKLTEARIIEGGTIGPAPDLDESHT